MISKSRRPIVQQLLTLSASKRRGPQASWLLVIFLIDAAIAVELRAQATFTPLGTFGATRAAARDVSADGSVVVGTAVDVATNTISVFRWTAEGSMLRPSSSEDVAVSADGTTVVGSYLSPNGTEAFRWTADGMFQGLGDLPGGAFNSAAFDVSTNGSVVVGFGSIVSDGQSAGQAFRWTEQDGMVAIAEPHTAARATSADGSVVIGDSTTGGTFRFPELAGRPGFNLPGSFDTFLHAISAEGSVVVGHSEFRVGLSGFRNEALRWTASDGAVSLLGPNSNSIAYDISGDGLAIVGSRSDSGPFYWTASTGALDLQDLLISLGATNLDGWELGPAFGISADGRTIVGAGRLNNGPVQGWVATIPEPSTVVLGAAAAILILMLCLRQRFASAACKHLGQCRCSAMRQQ